LVTTNRVVGPLLNCSALLMLRRSVGHLPAWSSASPIRRTGAASAARRGLGISPMVYARSSRSQQAEIAGTAQPLSARQAIATPGQRARSARTTRVRIATTPWLAWPSPRRSTAVTTWSVSPATINQGRDWCWAY
jgi:hypothetical protein